MSKDHYGCNETHGRVWETKYLLTASWLARRDPRSRPTGDEEEMEDCCGLDDGSG